MTSLLRRLRRKLFGETWTIPLGIAAALVLALIFRALLSSGEWRTVGGFALAALLIPTLIGSLSLERCRTREESAAAQTQQPINHKE